ncbi:hypothetical protein EI42_03079 [Thermosporothrix hazakensis]|jgi:Uma2 family endonuclease|uniref:Restriction endonuclease n=3 Tax=Thermosporothrix TaxID=768650 RepID=A0A326UK02_THEHA|nr:hypothetical protein EI42_03079 [Thermosporothrix hazakensis]GCE45293.1 hypothetical protein KTH_01620 [Thermosporothrix hazakensis]
MMGTRGETSMSVADYLRLDRASEGVRYEYLDGRVYALTGGTIAHARIASILRNCWIRIYKGAPVGSIPQMCGCNWLRPGMCIPM